MKTKLAILSFSLLFLMGLSSAMALEYMTTSAEFDTYIRSMVGQPYTLTISKLNESCINAVNFNMSRYKMKFVQQPIKQLYCFTYGSRTYCRSLSNVEYYNTYCVLSSGSSQTTTWSVKVYLDGQIKRNEMNCNNPNYNMTGLGCNPNDPQYTTFHLYQPTGMNISYLKA